MEAGEQEIAAGSEPVGENKRQSQVGHVHMQTHDELNQSTIPAVCGASLLQTDISDALQLHQQKLDGVVRHACGLGEILFKPSIDPEGTNSFPQKADGWDAQRNIKTH